jgi:hypothetical protein
MLLEEVSLGFQNLGESRKNDLNYIAQLKYVDSKIIEKSEMAFREAKREIVRCQDCCKWKHRYLK